MNPPDLRIWEAAAFVALAALVVAVPVYVARESNRRRAEPGADAAPATFLGRDACIDCHPEEYESWTGSDHDKAMAEATGETVSGDFDDATFEHNGIVSRFYRRDGRYFVATQGPGGTMAEFEIEYTFGFEPLQQYLVRFPGGRLQALSIAWDVERNEWFHLYPDQDIPPDDWLHWTRGGQNWNGMCAECHSTDLRKNFDPDTQTYATTWQEIDVSCEACHGPASRHVAWAEIEPMGRPSLPNYGLLVPTVGISSREQVELCAPCHSRRSELGDYDHTQTEMMDALLPSLLQEGLYYADGQILDEVYVYGSFLQSKMYRNDVRCSDCHDVHGLKPVKEGNDLCIQCHLADTYDSYEHHFHQKIYEDKPSDGALCVKCHMVERPYMVVDWRADHSFRRPRPDLTERIGTPNACTQGGCHDDKPLQWSLDAYLKWYGEARKPQYGTILAPGRDADPEALDGLVRLAEGTLYPAIVRATALSLLRQYPVDRTLRTFETALADDEVLLRYTAVDSLPPMDVDSLVRVVTPLLFDPVRLVRMQAAVTLTTVPLEKLKPYQQEAYEAALADYRDAMERSLDFASSGLNLAIVYENLGQPDLAEEAYLRALEVDDLFYPAKMNLALLLARQGRLEEAETLYRQVIEAYPDRYDAAYSLGLLLAEMNRAAEAVEFLEKAARGLPRESRVHYNLGLLLQQTGEADAAETALRHALDLEPDNLDVLYALADHYIKRGRLSDALPLADEMIRLHPEAAIGRDLKRWIENRL